ncbi:MAG: hypothetical protein KKG95_06950 [Candidatus Omnitrophica bacterium]|nr:hypothetical protein [Candidatus Omnitrophota bacterium]MBU1785056.1 hypothetical protein [Candidatus Omnitrophota bacterium]
MRRIISIAALFLFINCFIFPDAEAAVDTSASPYELSEVSSAYARSDPETFTVPAHLGEVKYFHRGDTDKIVMHIQDAHCNRFAQHKISDIIDYLNREYGVSMVNLEGGSGDYDLSVFTSITGEAIRMEVADYFVKTGDVNGAEFYAINNPGKVKLWGIEDKDLYLANLKIYQDSLGYKQDVDKHLNELTYILNNLKRHIYTPALLKTDMAYNAYKAEKMEFREYLEFLIEKAGKNAIEVRRYKNLYLLGKAMELEDTIDFRKANTERSTLVDELKKSLSRNETRELVTRSVDFKAKKISQKAFYNYLLGKVKETTMDVGRFPAFSNYVIYVGIYEAVDRVKVMVELDELEAEIKEPLYGNDTQRRLNTLSRNLALTKNLFAITLTRTDYQYYRENEDLFVVRDYLKFIAEEAPRYKIGARPGADITKLDSYRENIVKFYEYSFKRDEVFLKNMRFSAVPGGSRSAVLMTGGFHTDNLCGLFEKEGISYVSIIPKFTSEKGYECPYFDLLAGETADIQQMLRSALARGATLQIASKLSALGKDVWDREEVDAFHDAVIMLRMIGEQKGSDAIRKGVKDIVLPKNSENLIVSLQDDSEIHINLSEFKATVRSVTLQEAAADKGYASEELIGQSASIETRNSAVTEADAEARVLDPAYAGLIGKWVVNGEVVSDEHITAEEIEADAALQLTHTDSESGVVTRMVVGIVETVDNEVKRKIQEELECLLEMTNVLTTKGENSEYSIIEGLIDEIINVKVGMEVKIIEEHEIIKGVFGVNNVVYLNRELINSPLSLLHEMIHGSAKLKKLFEGVDAHTIGRGVGEDVRIAYEMLDGSSKGAEDVGPFIDVLNKKMEDLGLRQMTGSEKELIRYNFNHWEERRNAVPLYVNIDVSEKSLLFGLQDHLDPTGNAALTDKIGEMSDGLKPGGVNIIVDESYDDLTASVRRKWAQKTGRKFRKKWGVNVEYRPEKLSDEKSIGNILNRIREDLKDEEKYPAPMVLFKCVRAETVTQLKKLLDEEYMELKNVVSIVDLSKAGVKADEHHDNIVRLIHYANQVLNWERLGAYFKTGEKERMRLGKEMISRLRQAKYFDENQFYRKFGKEGVKNASNEEFFKFMEDLKTGEILVTITKIDWKEIQEYNDAMEAVYRSL